MFLSVSFPRSLLIGCALLFIGTSGLPAAEVIVDNTDAGFSVLSGTWGTRTAGTGEYGTNYRRTATATTASAEVQWQPTIPTAGDYQVFVWYPSGDGNHVTDARYTVRHNSGSQTVSVNQQINTGQWVLLGTFNFPAGSSANGRVTLTNQSATTGAYVYADAVRFYKPEPVDLVMAVSPPGAGTTIPAVGGPYTYNQGEVVNISATPAANYVFSQWQVSAGSNVASPTSATTTVTMDVTKTVTAVFVPIELTMAVSPAGAGTTVPPVGGPYPKSLNEVVSIQATANEGYTFDHWTVSAGSSVADPNSPSTTVTMDTRKTVTAVFNAPAPPQFRAFWADAFHEGYKSKAQIDAMISRALTGGYNVLVPEVLAFHDNPTPVSTGHGAYWNSSILPKAGDIDPTDLPNGDPLLYLIQQAHANGLEVHGWLVAFRVSGAWPPAGNSYLAAHPELISVPRASAGTGTPAKTGSYYVLDAGSPDVQDYLMAIIRELVTNYEIDGVNWDYIRYTQTDGGYPTSATYEKSGLRRFCNIEGYGCTLPLNTNAPPATGDVKWDNFRRRTIDEVVRRTRVEAAAIASNPRQPVRFTCDLVTWGDAPANFSSSSAYGLFSNWEFWMRQGYLDGGMPMCYDREYDSSQALWYRNWVKACLNWRYQRHMYIGQANYLNIMADSVTQLSYAYQTDETPPRSANGTVNYSYYTTEDENQDGTGNNDWTWYDYVGTYLFTSPSPVPSMPWRDPATATEGTLWGRVTRGGVPVDNATVQVGALPSIRTDGGGYYVATLIPAATGSSTSYDVTGTEGADTRTYPGVQVFAGDLRRLDIELLPSGPTITQQPQPQHICAGTEAIFEVGATGSGTLIYQWQKYGTAWDDLADGGHYSGVTTATLTVSDADGGDIADYRCVVTDAYGSANSDAAALTLKAATEIAQQPTAQNVCPGSTATFTVAGTGEGTIAYQWQKYGATWENLNEGGHYSGVTTATLTVSDADDGDAATYRCVVTAECGSLASSAAALTLKAVVAADFDADCDVDAADYAVFESCASGPAVSFLSGCEGPDLDDDFDVDQADLARFQRCYGGQDVPVDPACAN